MIVMPLFNDQYDNAQRLAETGLGVRLDPYRFNDHELVDAVNQLLQDAVLHEKLASAAQRIQSSKTHNELCDRIEQLMIKKSAKKHDK